MEMISDKNNNLDKLYYNDFLCKKRRTKMKEPETGKKENTGKSGYSITTWRLHLWCRHPEWLRTTQEFYNRIAEFYYNLLLDHTDLWEMGSQQTLRELEIMSIPGRGGRIPSDPLPWQKVPLYFRRAAANEGIASAKSYLSRFAQDEKIGRAEKLNAAVTYYKGMYQDFSAKEITLRVWTGDTWTWMHCRLSGRDFPENARLMSPSVVFEYKYDMLHVPVRQNNENTATVRQRMQAGCRILCIQFTNSDAFAVGVVLDGTGQEIAVKFWKGGKEYSHHCRKLLEKIQKSQEATGGRQTGRVDQKYWMHLKHLSEHYGHQVTSQILRFAVEQDVSVIVLPRYNQEYSRNVMKGSGNWGPLHLSTRIRQYLDYKAWKNGIIVIEVHATGISTNCARCGAEIIRTDTRAELCCCANGHQTNRYLNAVRNLGKKWASLTLWYPPAGRIREELPAPGPDAPRTRRSEAWWRSGTSPPGTGRTGTGPGFPTYASDWRILGGGAHRSAGRSAGRPGGR